MDRYLFRRYALFVLSLFINALGVAFITKALLGTSPITSVNYVLSMFTPLTMGQWTILLNLTFVLLDLLFMTREDLRRERTSYLLQIPISLSFGLFIDCAMLMLFWLEPVAYAAKLLWLIVGCFILAAGIALEVRVNVAMTAGEYLVQVICRRHHFDFGYTKLAFDLTLVLLACLLSYLFMSDIRGVREGTVVAALAVGPIVHFLTPCFRRLDHWTGLDGAAGQGTAAAPDADHAVITIAREFGSGGHRLGELLARELHLPLYDRQFIRLAAQKSGVDERYIVENEQSIPSFWLKASSRRAHGPDAASLPTTCSSLPRARLCRSWPPRGPASSSAAAPTSCCAPRRGCSASSAAATGRMPWPAASRSMTFPNRRPRPKSSASTATAATTMSSIPGSGGPTRTTTT